ncbi:hypothetical protein BGX28_005947, partial [Mortierella sp. GBA30]
MGAHTDPVKSPKTRTGDIKGHNPLRPSQTQEQLFRLIVRCTRIISHTAHKPVLPCLRCRENYYHQGLSAMVKSEIG